MGFITPSTPKVISEEPSSTIISEEIRTSQGYSREK
jgi:hypothetical protein